MRLKQGPPDLMLFLVVVLLVCIGLIMIFSASAVTSDVKYQDAFSLLKAVDRGGLRFDRHAGLNEDELPETAGIGVAGLILALICLVAVLLPGIGMDVRGLCARLIWGSPALPRN